MLDENRLVDPSAHHGAGALFRGPGAALLHGLYCVWLPRQGGTLFLLSRLRYRLDSGIALRLILLAAPQEEQYQYECQQRR